MGISWEEDYWEFVSGAIRYSQRYGSDQWTTPVGWMPQLGWYRTPSLTADFYHAPVTLAWQNENTSLFYLQGEIGSWGETTNLGTGAHPTLSAAFSSGESDLALWRGLNPPYPILQEAITVHYSAHNGLSNITTREGRGARLMFKNGSLHIGVLAAKTNSENMRFVGMSDTTRINLSQFEGVLSTEPFAGNGILTLKTLFSLKGQLPNGLGVRLALRDARTGQIVEFIRTFSIGDDTLVTFQRSLNHGSRQLRLALQPVGIAQLKRISLERWFVVDETGESPLAKTSLPSSALKQLPEEYALHPSYPNPFNPSTTIKFDLPENSNVSLVVYDVLGRKVAELVNGVQEAGFKSIQWDAANMASGIYFARFTAADAHGNVKLSRVNKLLLTK